MGKLGFWQGGKRDAVGPDDQSANGPADNPEPVGRARAWINQRDTQAEALLLLKNYEESRQGWFWSTDRNGRLTYLTESVAPRLSAEPQSVVGSAFVDLFLPSDDGVGAPRTLPFILARQSKFEKLTLRAASDSEECWWAVSGCPQFDAAGQFIGYRGSGVDITEQRRSSEHASQLAMYDSLTGLPNRLRMSQVLHANLVAFEQQKRSCAVMLVDLDRFKQVNDTLGHPAGDALLKQVAERLLRIVGDRDRVFRVGGDEFQIIVRDCEDRGILGDLGNTIIANLSQPYSVEGSRCIIGASIGVAIGPFDGRTSEELIRNADLALYAAKGSGRGRFRFYSTELLQAAEDRRVLEEDLRDALAKGEIKLFYQPIVDARTNVTTGVEALVRWDHPERGPISPALFIPIAEEANLIEPLGEWVLRKACEDAATWPGKLRVAVNVSPIQFSNESLPQIVMSALASSGLSPARLELEITEGVFLSESAETDTMFATLKDIGVRLALDDFGTGYSSLGYLRTAPFDKIKIDQSFVRAATLPGSRNRAIIAAIVALAEALGMETTAEGIESLDQLELVRHLRVSHVQGYVYSKAIDSAAITDRLQTGDWSIAPSGPAKQRSDRFSMYRNVGVIFANRYNSVLIRNLSESGALIEGLLDVPIGSLLIVDFGDGQLAFAKVRRSRKRQQGIEFEQPLVSDGNGGMCTSRRVSPYLMGMAGLSANSESGGPAFDADHPVSLEELRSKLGLAVATRPLQLGTGEGAGTSAAAGDPTVHAGSDGTGKAQGDGLPTKNGAGGGNSPAAVERPTIRQLSDRYLDHVRGDKERHEIDRSYLKDHILPKFGQMHPDELAPSDVAAWLVAKVKEEGYPPEKVNRLQAILGQMYVLAMQWGVPGSGGEALDGVSVFTRRGDEERCLTAEEIERLNAAAQASHNPQLKYIVSLLMLTGARQRELLEARWADIDMKAGIWRIPTSKSGQVRNVTLSQASLDVLRELPRWPDCSFVIANPKTKKPYRSFFNSWHTARMKAGLFDVEMDDLRHSAISDAVGMAPATDFVGNMLGRTKRSPVRLRAAL